MTSERPGSADNDHPRVVSRLEGFAPIGPSEFAFLADMADPPQTFERGEPIRSEGKAPTTLCLLLKGWAASAVTLENGSRQLNSISLPGDMLGLPSLALRHPIDEVIALSPTIVCPIPIDRIGQMFALRPRLAALMFLVSQEERMFAMERLALLGQASALTRLAALFLRLQERVSRLEGRANTRFFMPLTQKDMGDLIGVSGVHVNALIKQFRTAGVVTIKARELAISDLETLRAMAGVANWRLSEPDWLPAG